MRWSRRARPPSPLRQLDNGKASERLGARVKLQRPKGKKGFLREKRIFSLSAH